MKIDCFYQSWPVQTGRYEVSSIIGLVVQGCVRSELKLKKKIVNLEIYEILSQISKHSLAMHLN